MLSLLAYILTILALVLCVPVVVLTIEIVAAVVLNERLQTDAHPNQPRPRVAVIVPAHDEGTGLLPTIADVEAHLRPGDRLVVVADNCTDNTAKVARSAGAEVIERHDAQRFGKGYALDWGLRHLHADPPEIVIMVDADCRLEERAIDQLAFSCQATGHPTQALYRMMKAPEAEESGEQRVAHFAWLVKNYVRPIGLAKLRLPCQLMGTGMAFPWRAIRAVELASGNLVEDLKLGLDLAASGMPPHLCPQTYIESAFPASEMGWLTQRHRWEVGSLRTLIENAPVFLWKACVTRNPALFVLALDALVPPLVMLAAALVIFLLLAAMAALVGIAIAPLLVTATAFTLFTMSIIFAWVFYGRSVVRMADAGSLIAYLFRKLHIYQSRDGKGSRWIRTDRS